MIAHVLFATPSPGRVGNQGTELIPFVLKLFRRSRDQSVAVDLGPPFPEVAVAANMVEVRLRVQHHDSIVGTHGRGVAVDGRRGQRIRRCIRQQRGLLAHDKAGVDRQGRNVGETGDGEAA